MPPSSSPARSLHHRLSSSCSSLGEGEAAPSSCSNARKGGVSRQGGWARRRKETLPWLVLSPPPHQHSDPARVGGLAAGPLPGWLAGWGDPSVGLPPGGGRGGGGGEGATGGAAFAAGSSAPAGAFRAAPSASCPAAPAAQVPRPRLRRPSRHSRAGWRRRGAPRHSREPGPPSQAPLPWDLGGEFLPMQEEGGGRERERGISPLPRAPARLDHQGRATCGSIFGSGWADIIPLIPTTTRAAAVDALLRALSLSEAPRAGSGGSWGDAGSRRILLGCHRSHPSPLGSAHLSGQPGFLKGQRLGRGEAGDDRAAAAA